MILCSRLQGGGSTGSPTMVRQAHQPWFDRLTNHGSTGSPTVLRLYLPKRMGFANAVLGATYAAV